MPGCCCCRPDAYVNKNGVTIGYIHFPCAPVACCGQLKLDVYKGRDKNPTNRAYSFIAPLAHCHCQCGKSLGCCCDICKTMEFKIKDKNGYFVNYFAKEYNGCSNECCTMADKYNFEFPSQDDDENALFLAAAYFIDTAFFECNYCGYGTI